VHEKGKEQLPMFEYRGADVVYQAFSLAAHETQMYLAVSRL
jgi:hypothetical protein